MRKYKDYQKNKKELYLSKEEMKNVKWINFKIIVPTNEDKEEMMEAFYHIHNSDIDTDYIAVNQIAHQYLSEEDGGNNIIIDKELCDKLNKK